MILIQYMNAGTNDEQQKQQSSEASSKYKSKWEVPAEGDQAVKQPWQEQSNWIISKWLVGILYHWNGWLIWAS